jgi:sugar phosphate isomerase/epimerase
MVLFRGIAFANWGFMHLSIEKSISKIAELGFEGVEFWASEPYNMLNYNKKKRRLLAQLLKEHELQSVSICPDYTHKWWETGKGVKPTINPERFVKLMRKNMEVAVDLGCEKCNIHSMNFSPNTNMEISWNNLIDSFLGCVDIAKSLGLILCYEPEPGMAFCNLQDVFNILREVSSRNFGILYDTALMYVLSGGDPIGSLMRLKDKVVHVHLSDHDESIDKIRSIRIERTIDLLNGRVPLGRGKIELQGILKALNEIGYTGWLTVEPAGITRNPEQAAVDSKDFVKSLIGGSDL